MRIDWPSERAAPGSFFDPNSTMITKATIRIFHGLSNRSPIIFKSSLVAGVSRAWMMNRAQSQAKAAAAAQRNARGGPPGGAVSAGGGRRGAVAAAGSGRRGEVGEVVGDRRGLGEPGAERLVDDHLGEVVR